VENERLAEAVLVYMPRVLTLTNPVICSGSEAEGYRRFARDVLLEEARQDISYAVLTPRDSRIRNQPS
jgi:hypothetical protein